MIVRKKISRAFTLVEVLIATAILSLLILLLTSLLSGVHRTWVAGEQKVSEFQDGRAILELISRELSQAVISQKLQFVQNPTLTGANQRLNSDSIFWQAPAAPTANGNLAEIGYYLTEDATKTGADVYQLKRFYVPPIDNTNYKIFTTGYQPTDSSAPWVTSPTSLSNTVASGVIAFWVRCYDRNDDLIPWLSANVGAAAPLKFNSAAHFQPAIAGTSSSFKYTSATNTVRANLLPVAVELTLVTVDAQTFKRNPTIPAQTAQSGPSDLPVVSASFSQQLISNKITSARMFSTRVNLMNSGE
jgi:prepilin-type N-terminal cleavage/methylation domain-containing protein